MPEHSASGYIRSIEYIDRYYGEFNPWMLRYVAALHGIACPDFSEGFTYCDLGCGSGMSTLMLAAANPAAQFFGVDFNPEHIRHGEQTRQVAGIDNCVLLERTFGEIYADALPDMDIIVLHGVYSWVSDETKAELRDILRWKLKPGGIALITYNALPGWAPLAPLRDFMREYALGSSVDILDVAREGIKYLHFLAETDAPYFRNNTAARQMLDLLGRHDIRYIAHEFFTKHWRPLYFREAAEDLIKAGLNFCGQFPLYLNYGEICLPTASQSITTTAPNRIAFETHKDFVRNTMFRWDIFVKATPQFAPDSPENHRDIRFGLLKSIGEIQLEMQIPGGRKIGLNGEIYSRILDFFNLNCGATLGETFASLTNYKPEEVVSAVQYMVMLDAVRPFAKHVKTQIPSVAGLSQANRTFADIQLTADGSVVLAAPVFGAGILMGREDADELLGKTHGKQEHTKVFERAAALGL